MKNSLEIKLASSSLPAKAIMIIKRETGLSISSIKQRAETGRSIFECPVYDDAGLSLINQLKRALQSVDVETRLFENGREVPSQFFDNLEALHKSIDEESELYPD